MSRGAIPAEGGVKDVIIAIVMGIVAGLLLKVLFFKDSNIMWDAVFGLVGGVAAYYLYTSSISADVSKAVFALGTATIVGGVLHELWGRFGKSHA